ncbi:Putative protein of unknown function [Podospora comata]|uniref:Uncharacterized protein n=1 Tax=Podospora comata TaxID=48703 RepID=A0ABY6RT76_PODCO|nr:Putative protein of unknown function [Podospora comata]
MPSNTTPLAVPWRFFLARTRLLGLKTTRHHYTPYRAVGPLGSSRPRVIPARPDSAQTSFLRWHQKGTDPQPLKEASPHLVHAKLITDQSQPCVSSNHPNSTIPSRSPLPLTAIRTARQASDVGSDRQTIDT